MAETASAGGGFMKAIPGIGLGLSILGAGKSLFDGIAQKKKVAEAERKSAAALNEAKTRLEVNRMEGIQVPIDSYEMAMRERTAQQMQSLEGLREAGPRSLAAGVGKLGLVAGQATEADRKNLEKALIDREKLIADQEAVIDRSLASLSLQEAIGFEKEARDKEMMGAAQISSGIQGLGSAVNQFAKSRDLYNQRQGQLQVAKDFQEQSGLYGDMNARQARRAMIDSGITDQGFANLSGGLVSYQTPSFMGLQATPIVAPQLDFTQTLAPMPTFNQ